MTSPRPPRRRKPRLVDRRFQLGLAGRIAAVFVLLFAVGILVVFAPSVFGLLTGVDLSELQPAAQEFLVLHRRIWPAVLIVLVGIFAYSLYFSHRIAGPIYRINTVLRMLLRGESPAHVELRKGDYFHDTAELLERLARRLDSGRTKEPPGDSRGAGDRR